MVLGLPYDEKCDVFGFSMIMWEVLHNSTEPFPKSEMVFVELRMANNDNCRPEIDPDLHLNDISKKWYIDLMKCCWARNPQDRPSFSSIADTINQYIPAAKNLAQ